VLGHVRDLGRSEIVRLRVGSSAPMAATRRRSTAWASGGD